MKQKILLLMTALFSFAGGARAVNAFTKHIDGGRYYLIASPCPEEVSPEIVDNMLGGEYDLYSFVPDAEGGLEWRNYKAENFNLEPGKGYLYACMEVEDVTLTFSGLPYDGDEYEITVHEGWNLLGNPFDCEVYVVGEGGIYVMNEEGTGLEEAYRAIGPMEGFFFYTREEGAVVTLVKGEGLHEVTDEGDPNEIVLPEHYQESHQNGIGEDEPEPTESYWPDFDYARFLDEGVLVAAIMIDGEIITVDYENWDKLEVAAFVGDECRGNEMYLYDGITEYGDLYLTLDGCPIYYDFNNTGEEVSFKMFDHQNGVLYENCEVRYQNESITILTGEDHFEGWEDPETPVFLCFTSTSSFDGLVLANNDLELDEEEKNTALISAFVDENEEENVTNVKLEGRTLYRNGFWNTLCLPFDVENIGDSPLEGATVMELDLEGKYNADGELDEAGAYQTGFDATDGTLYLYFIEAEEIEAGKPYIVKWEDEGLENITDPVFYQVPIDANEPTGITFAEGKVTFIGTYSYTEYNEENKYVLLMGSNSNLFYPDGEPTTVGAFRAYFELQNGLKAGEPEGEGGIKNFVLNFGDGETGIKTTNLTNEAGAWYSIDGRQLSGKPTQKGIYINRNKKMFIQR